MKFFIFLLIIAGGLYYAYSAGMFDSVINSAQNTAQRTGAFATDQAVKDTNY